jgi:hypothetical protein
LFSEPRAQDDHRYLWYGSLFAKIARLRDSAISEVCHPGLIVARSQPQVWEDMLSPPDFLKRFTALTLDLGACPDGMHACASLSFPRWRCCHYSQHCGALIESEIAPSARVRTAAARLQPRPAYSQNRGKIEKLATG